MDGAEGVSRGLFRLPNEILLNVFNYFPTPSLVPLMPICQHFHSLILRLLLHRLQLASGLAGHTLYFECFHPSAKNSAAKLFCKSLGTNGLQELQCDLSDHFDILGPHSKITSLYTRFRPQCNEPDYPRRTLRHPAGDIPGSRTYRDPNPGAIETIADDVVRETIMVDAHDLFSQLSTLCFLGKRESSRGLLFSYQQVSDGTVRVWRDWLSRQCEKKSWTDGEAVVVHHDVPNSPTSKGKTRADSVTEYPDPTKDPSILWSNTQSGNVGIKFRVAERKWRQNTPVMYLSDVEVPVSYEVEYEGKFNDGLANHVQSLTGRAELLIPTTRLLLKLEAAEDQINNQIGKAIVFGSFSDPNVQEVDTAGGQLRP